MVSIQPMAIWMDKYHSRIEEFERERKMQTKKSIEKNSKSNVMHLNCEISQISKYYFRFRNNNERIR